jgi:(2Fe-2S) ferredoxin
MELTFKRLENVKDLDELRQRLHKEHRESTAHRVRVCCGTACQATGSLKLIDQFEKEAAQQHVELEIVKTGCQGFCQRGPVVIQDPQEIFYQKVKVVDVPTLFSDSVLHGVAYRKQLYREFSLSDPNEKVQDIPFYKKQKRLALHRNGVVDPCNIYDAIREDGYAGLATVVTDMTPDEVIEIIKKSGLRASGSIQKNLALRSRRWCVTATKVIPARLWTGRSWKGILIRFSRGCSSMHMPSGHSTATYTCVMNILWL